MNIRGGFVVGWRVGDQTYRNEDGRPITWLVENETGEVLELLLVISGRMNTFPQFMLPPMTWQQEPAPDENPTEIPQRQTEGIPVSTVARRPRAAPNKTQV